MPFIAWQYRCSKIDFVFIFPAVGRSQDWLAMTINLYQHLWHGNDHGLHNLRSIDRLTSLLWPARIYIFLSQNILMPKWLFVFISNATIQWILFTVNKNVGQKLCTFVAFDFHIVSSGIFFFINQSEISISFFFRFLFQSEKYIE